MGAAETKEPITPPLNATDFTLDKADHRSTFLTLLNYFSYATSVHDARYRAVMDEFTGTPYPYQTPQGMALVVLAMMLKANATEQAITGIQQFFASSSASDDAAADDYSDEQDENRHMTVCSSANLTAPMLKSVHDTSFWVEGVCQFGLGALGTVANLFAIHMLCSRRLESFFNRLLACLLVTHTVYVVSTLLVYLSHQSDGYYVKATFSYFLYPLRSAFLHASTFLTVLMARQRYMAIRHPIEYRNSTIGINPWRPALVQAFLAILMAGFLVTPLLFETRFEDVNAIVEEQVNQTHLIYYNVTSRHMSLADLRLNPQYVIWYKNAVTIITTLIIPFLLLGYWNLRTAQVLRRRQRLRDRPMNASRVASQQPTAASVRAGSFNNNNNTNTNNNNNNNNSQHMQPESVELVVNNEPTGTMAGSQPRQLANMAKAEEAKKARVLFVIVFMFMLCNVPRTVLNVEELIIVVRTYSQSGLFGAGPSSVPCYTPPFWARILNCFSQFFLTFNGSTGSLIYCVMCRNFRAEVKARFSHLV